MCSFLHTLLPPLLSMQNMDPTLKSVAATMQECSDTREDPDQYAKDGGRGRQAQVCDAGQPQTTSLQTYCYLRKISPYLFRVSRDMSPVICKQKHSKLNFTILDSYSL